jgi:hypothetical protein
MPPVMVKLRRSLTFSPPRSIVTAPAPLIEATLNEKACDEPMCGCPRRLNTMRSIALASVAVPTVERALAPMRSWSTMIAVVRPSSTVDVGPRDVGMKPCTNGAVGLVDEPLRLGGDRAEHQRALAGARHAGEDREPALGQLDVDVLEVVLRAPRARG